MIKPGDTVRYLNSVGGGKVIRVDGKMAYVDEDGFETPVLIKDLVVVLPAGHESQVKGASLMFDQKAFDEGKSDKLKIEEPLPAKEISAQPDLPLVETPHGDKMNLVIAFEPSDVKNLGKSTFSAVLVNDSNFFIDFIFLRRSAEERGWTLVFRGTVMPNELIDLVSLKHEDLPDYERIAIQCVVYKENKSFTLQPPVGVSKRLDLTKFHKFHCFRPGVYFENPVLEFPLVKDGNLTETVVSQRDDNETRLERSIKELSDKFGGHQEKGKKKPNPSDNPNKLLPLIEVDLHIGELTDSLAGLEPKDMLGLQLDTVRKIMNENRKRIGQKIVFIHGKGEGVLRKEVLALLKKEFPKAEVQDASFREYGFGATLVTVH